MEMERDGSLVASALKMAGGLAAKWHGHRFCQQGVAGQISTALLLLVFAQSFEVSVLLLYLLFFLRFASFFVYQTLWLLFFFSVLFFFANDLF